jgi:hypothetical protein
MADSRLFSLVIHCTKKHFPNNLERGSEFHSSCANREKYPLLQCCIPRRKTFFMCRTWAFVAVNIRIVVSWDMTPRRLAVGQRPGRTYSFCLECRNYLHPQDDFVVYL